MKSSYWCLGTLSASVVLVSACSGSSFTKEGGGRKVSSAAVPEYPVSARFEELLPNEAQDIEQIRAGILAIQAKEQKDHGQYLRGTHSKGTCMDGQLEIYDVQQSAPGVAKRIQKGMFSVPGKYEAALRFANADGKINPDVKKDVRAISFSVAMPPELSNPQGRMDFAMNNATTFPINDAQVFADIMRLASEGPVKSAEEVGLWRIAKAGEGIADGKLIQEQPGKTPYQKLRYWSTVPFALGEDEAVKYSLKPCAENASQALNLADPNELKNELIRHVMNDSAMSCFEFQVQLLDASKMTHGLRRAKESESWWVENASYEWNEKQAPFYPVGKLTLTAKSVVDDQVCEKRWINVLANSSSIHHGLGSINRARTTAERASAEVRLGN